MSIDLRELWKAPLLNHTVNINITQSMYEAAFALINAGVQFEILNSQSLNKFKDETFYSEDNDLPYLTKIVRYNFTDSFINKPTSRNNRFEGMIMACRDKAKNLGIPEYKLLYVTQFKIKELSNICESLVILRNYASHPTQDRDDIGLSIQISSLLLRYIEVNDLVKRDKWQVIFNKIRGKCFQILNELILHNPTDEFIEVNQYNSDDEEKSKLDEILSSLSQLSNKIDINYSKNIPKKDTLKDEENILKGAGIEDFEIFTDKLSPEILKQKLLQLRKKIKIDLSVSENKNILNADIINEMILFGSSNKNEWERLLSVSKLKIKNEKLFNKQMTIYWEQIQDLINKVDWEQ